MSEIGEWQWQGRGGCESIPSLQLLLSAVSFPFAISIVTFSFLSFGPECLIMTKGMFFRSYMITFKNDNDINRVVNWNGFCCSSNICSDHYKVSRKQHSYHNWHSSHNIPRRVGGGGVLGVRSNPLWNSIVVNEPPLKRMNSPLLSKRTPPPPKKRPQLKNVLKILFSKKNVLSSEKKFSFLKKRTPSGKPQLRACIPVTNLYRLYLGSLLKFHPIICQSTWTRDCLSPQQLQINTSHLGFLNGYLPKQWSLHFTFCRFQEPRDLESIHADWISRFQVIRCHLERYSSFTRIRKSGWFILNEYFLWLTLVLLKSSPFDLSSQHVHDADPHTIVCFIQFCSRHVCFKRELKGEPGDPGRDPARFQQLNDIAKKWEVGITWFRIITLHKVLTCTDWNLTIDWNWNTFMFLFHIWSQDDITEDFFSTFIDLWTSRQLYLKLHFFQCPGIYILPLDVIHFIVWKDKGMILIATSKVRHIDST